MECNRISPGHLLHFEKEIYFLNIELHRPAFETRLRKLSNLFGFMKHSRQDNYGRELIETDNIEVSFLVLAVLTTRRGTRTSNYENFILSSKLLFYLY